MASLTETTPARNPATAFYAHFHGLSGVITLHNGRALFLEYESTAVTAITAADVPHVVRLGAVEDAMAQWIADRTAGGYAKIATSRTEGRA